MIKMKKHFAPLCCSLASVVLATSQAVADDDVESPWSVNAEAAGAAPVTEPQSDAYGVGVAGGLGVYRDTIPEIELGVRIGGEYIASEGQPEEPGIDNAGDLGVASLNAAMRVRPFEGQAEENEGLWLEAAGGPGIQQDQVRAVVSPAVGYTFDAGQFGIGPSARYTHVFEPSQFDGDDTQIASVGVELSVLPDMEKEPAAEEPQRFVYRPLPKTEQMKDEPVRPNDADGDGWSDGMDLCVNDPEIWNGYNDHDGCPDSAVAEFENDRMSIDERVFFNYDSSQLRSEGKEKLREIAAQHATDTTPWSQLTISGYADRRGPEEYNMELSQQRAQAVKSYLVAEGIPDDIVDVRAYGENRPLIEDPSTAEEYRLNRRVEFTLKR